MLKRDSGITLLAGILVAVVLTAAAHASSPLGIGTAEPTFETGGFGGTLLAWVNYEQQGFYRALTGALKAMRHDPWKLSALIGLSFVYGVFHAAGPGHGKAVISSYMIANEIQLRRGIMISFISSMLQAATAILVVGAAYLILRGTSVSLTNATDFLELLSYAGVAAFGLWLLIRKVRSAFFGTGPAAGRKVGETLHDQGYDRHPHDHHHAHLKSHGNRVADFCEECGHAHMPSPQSLGGENFSIREAISAVIAVGLRPCSGAIIVLTFSLLNGLYLGGVLSVIAMAVGTAITVSALAMTAVSAKGAAVRLAGQSGNAAMRVGTAIEIIGAFLVMSMGILLLVASLRF